jgi:antitoxin ParD1/3/4
VNTENHYHTDSVMADDISPEYEQFIQYELESGVYPGRGELLDEAVGLLKRRRDLQREIQAGIDSGAGVPASEVFTRLEEKARSLASGERS